MKSRIRVRRAPAGLKALAHTSSQVQYYATALAFLWVQMPKEHQDAVMGFFGFTPQQMLLTGAATWALATLLAKNTSISVDRKCEPEMNQEGPDHEG